MKKWGAVFSALLLTASITACGTADVNDMNDRRIYDVNDINGVYDVNDYNDNIYDVNDRNNFNYRMKDAPLRNDPEATDKDDRVFDADRDDTFFDDEDLNMNRTNNNR